MSKKIQAKLGRYFSSDSDHSVTSVPVSISCVQVQVQVQVQDNNNVLSSTSLSVSEYADSATEPVSNLSLYQIEQLDLFRFD
jgi:hypothetical protein